jgi:hypothetical protein
MWSETGIVGAYLHRESREQGSDHPDGHADPNPSITFIRGVRNSCQRNRRPSKCLHWRWCSARFILANPRRLLLVSRRRGPHRTADKPHEDRGTDFDERMKWI